jgi:hypothetical protein
VRTPPTSEPVETIAQVVVALAGILSKECQIQSYEGPFLIANVAWVRFSVCHAKMLSLQSQRFITPSSGG